MQVVPRVVQVVRRAGEVCAPGARFTGVRRVVVVRHDRLGDLVLSLAAVDAMRRGYPGARLGLLVRPDLAPLARMVPGVDEVLEARAGWGRLRREIARFKADLVVCIARGAGLAWAAARAGVRRRVGTGYRAYSPLFTRTVDERRRFGGRHEAEYALSFAHRAGAPAGPATFPLVVPDTARGPVGDWRRAQRVEGRFVVLHPGSGGSCPRWPAGRFVELAARLVAGGIPAVFTVGPEDGWCSEVLDAAGPAVREIPRFSADLERLPALLESAALVVSNSTGPLHLAAALGTPTLGIYAPWSTCGVARWGPYAPNGWAVAADAEDAPRWSRAERRRRGEQVLAAVPAQAVEDCVTAILEGRRPEL